MTDDILDRLRAPHGYFGRLMRCQAADEIARLREALSDEEYVSKDTNEMFHEVRDELNISLLVNDKLRARIAELEAALKLMIDTQDEWEKGVSKVIGKQPSVFNRAIDTARAVLEKK
jgi:hypothetical protein